MEVRATAMHRCRVDMMGDLTGGALPSPLLLCAAPFLVPAVVVVVVAVVVVVVVVPAL
jgi:hypothetical protein